MIVNKYLPYQEITQQAIFQNCPKKKRKKKKKKAKPLWLITFGQFWTSR